MSGTRGGRVEAVGVGVWEERSQFLFNHSGALCGRAWVREGGR